MYNWDAVRLCNDETASCTTENSREYLDVIYRKTPGKPTR